MKEKKIKKHIFSKIILFLFMAFGITGFFSALWYRTIYGDVGFDAVLFTLFSDMEGVESNIVFDYLLNGLLPSVIFLIITFSIIFLIPIRKSKREKKKRYFLLPQWLSVFLSLVLSFSMLISGMQIVGMLEWVYLKLHQTNIYSDYYVDPKDVNIEFPEQKRNLIYIYLESMETTYLSESLDGGIDKVAMPELFNIAAQNINLSHNGIVGGARTVSGTTWTVGAVVGHSSGLPLKLPVGVDGNSVSDYFKEFLPGVTTINDILHDNGYYQVAMFGSDSEYGGKKQYLQQHGIDKILDIYTAYNDNIVPKGYWQWWGMEDKHLIEYAKQELLKLSEAGQPFSFTMLTADTHHIGGYVCDECKSKFDEQYENVIACSSRRMRKFLNWLQEQDFYENTTIVITGDHLSMDEAYFSRNMAEGYTRRVYNSFINAPVSDENTYYREFTTLDMFPSTLAAMGCKIEGERLGLGTNVFSGMKTYAEEMGFDEFNLEFTKNSKYYNERFLNMK